MKLRDRNGVIWAAAGLLVAAVLAGLIEPAAEHTETGRWLRETGGPAAETFVRDVLGSRWAFWVAWTLVPIVLLLTYRETSRHFSGRPRTPAEKKADLRVANECEKLVERLTEEATKCRSYRQSGNQDMTARHGFAVSYFFPIIARTLLSDELSRRKIKVNRNEVSLADAEGMEAAAQCYREVASALREGRYKWKTFTYKLQGAKQPSRRHESVSQGAE